MQICSYTFPVFCISSVYWNSSEISYISLPKGHTFAIDCTAIHVYCLVCSGLPPDYLLKEAKNTGKFFKCIGRVHSIENGEVSLSCRSSYKALTVEEYETVSVQLLFVGIHGNMPVVDRELAKFDLFRSYCERELSLLSSFLCYITLH